jgi:pimeloyl-ACP methyl ester carboxylesterase
MVMAWSTRVIDEPLHVALHAGERATQRGVGVVGKRLAGLDRRADANADLLAALDALDLPRVALIGHSLAGSELTYVAAHHPSRVAALVYLDAAYDRSTQDAAMAGVPDVFVPPTIASRWPTTNATASPRSPSSAPWRAAGCGRGRCVRRVS